MASWTNGSNSSRTWDTESVPQEVPGPPVQFIDENTLNGMSSLPVYNCASLPHFAIRLDALHTVQSPIVWSYAGCNPETPGIVRLVPKDLDPHTADIAEGHWMIGLGSVNEVVVDSPEATDILGKDGHVSLHVNGGDGPLLVSDSCAVVEFYSRQYGANMATYTATPML